MALNIVLKTKTADSDAEAGPTMAIPQRECRILFQKSGNRCAYTSCRRLLTSAGSNTQTPVVLGEVAHIIAESPDGPRGASPLSMKVRNAYDNLILLCNIHHQLIDDPQNVYSVERLHGMKENHERWVESVLGKGVVDDPTENLPRMKTEEIHSTVLPVERMPRFVYGVQCSQTDESAVNRQVGPPRAGEMTPLILRSGYLFTFQNLNDPSGPFAGLVAGQPVERFSSREWWDDPDRMKWFIDLTNRSLNKLTGRRGLWLDRDHRRYYFHPDQPGHDMEVAYRPLNQSITTRKVVWEPRTKKTGLGKGFWYHRAVSLRFVRLSKSEWCLVVRPELHVTADGSVPLRSDEIGSKVTKKKSRTFNYDLLSEVNFWRDFLSDSTPRIIMFFGEESIVVETTMMRGTVTWPGIPEEHAKPFKNVEYADDLLTWAEFARIEAAGSLDGDDEDTDDVDEDSDDDFA